MVPVLLARDTAFGSTFGIHDDRRSLGAFVQFLVPTGKSSLRLSTLVRSSSVCFLRPVRF